MGRLKNREQLRYREKLCFGMVINNWVTKNCVLSSLMCVSTYALNAFCDYAILRRTRIKLIDISPEYFAHTNIHTYMIVYI